MSVVHLALAHSKSLGGAEAIILSFPLDSEFLKSEAVSALFTPHFQSLLCQAHRYSDIY